ncbi:CDP-diacylglycerol--glycerol-3-phosphate 3-phosphatidyltransferase [bacterium]|nr:CDP-diacylglycerol--glycerol-3-phosphate 3-phosphatidyltransferase [bacterium]
MTRPSLLNLPNQLTLSRVLVSPLFMTLLLIENVWCRWGALALFAAASVTDMLDGWLARRHGQTTKFGKFMDPVADKLLIALALVSFVALRLAPTWAAMAIIGREILIMGLRTLVAYRGEMMESSVLSKIKTFGQMLYTSCAVLFLCWRDTLAAAGRTPTVPQLVAIASGLDLLLYIALVLTLYSGLDYIVKNRWLLLGLFKGNF